jgi:hypothetical protein
MKDAGGLRFSFAGWPDGKLPFMQHVERGQFLNDGPRGKLPPKRALAFQDFGQVECHGLLEKLLLETLPRRNQFMP